ncbi:hypothetical protein [Paracoccus sp. (in: a-proteobacteria)]|uniref:hypothetical protein n=1 Tax=Paracoccus sp. TaxID=267 RepID=UPI00396CA019
MCHHIMIVEGPFWTAVDRDKEVNDRGATAVEPFSSMAQTLKKLRAPRTLDAAILNIHLRTQDNFNVADILVQSKIPFVMGHDKRDVPPRFSSALHFEKPFTSSVCVDRVMQLAKDHSPQSS